jgi:hypothetical protein
MLNYTELKKPRALFFSHRAAAQYQALASIILGPHLMEKRIYRAVADKG